MHVRRWPLGLLLVLALFGAPDRARAGEPPLAAGASGGYLRLRPALLEDARLRRGLLSVLDWPPAEQLRQQLRLPAFGPGLLKSLGVDGTRDVIASLGLVDTAAVQKLLVPDRLPAPGKLPTVGYQIFIPYLDEGTVLGSLERLLGRRRVWVRPRQNPAALKELIGRLDDERDRAAARKTDADVVVQSMQLSFVLHVRRAQRLLEIRVCTQLHGAVATFAPAPAALRARLQQAGFFRSAAGLFVEPRGLADLGQAVGASAVVNALAGVDPKVKLQLWAAGVKELRSIEPLAAAATLLRSLVLSEDGASWELSDEGARQLRGLPYPTALAPASVRRLALALQKRLGTSLPAPFTSADLPRTVQEGGFASLWVAAAFLWPQALAWAATHGRALLEKPWPPELLLPRVAVQLDGKRHRLELKLKGPLGLRLPQHP